LFIVYLIKKKSQISNKNFTKLSNQNVIRHMVIYSTCACTDWLTTLFMKSN